MIYQSIGLHLSNDDIARNLCVDVSTVKRTVKLYNQTGSVSKTSLIYQGNQQKLSNITLFNSFYNTLYILEGNYGGITRNASSGVESAMCGLLRSHGFSRQKKQMIAQQRDELERLKFVSELTVYSPDMFIF